MYSSYLLPSYGNSMTSPWVMEKNAPLGPPPSYDDSEQYFAEPSSPSLPSPSLSSSSSDSHSSSDMQSAQMNVMKDLPPIPPSMPVPTFMSSDGFMHEDPSDSPTSFVPFKPFALHSFSNNLEDGFPLRVPAPEMRPHPFNTHDVTHADWAYFMSELDESRNQTHMDLINGAVVEMAEHLPIARRLVAHGIELQMKSHRSSPIAQVINRWNLEFFHPRLMEITLAQGRMAHTGPLDAEPADVLDQDHHSSTSADEHSHEYSVHVADYTSDGEDDSGFVHVLHKAKRSIGHIEHASDLRYGLCTRDRQRRRSRHEKRKALRKDCVDSADEKWRLVIAYKPLVLE
ncbi:hypothetical protein QCA50_011860 [Cerrena zonata]|uniref:Uncharacterized protein n=1 Tax=Cerrena zonata TaxID=2478898 RepID=A0AAW0G1M7_9APHY